MLSKLYSTAYWAVFALALSCFSANAIELPSVARNSEGDSVRLTAQPCTNPNVTRRIVPMYLEQFRAAHVEVGKERFEACWTEYGTDAFLFYPDGDKGLVPLKDFKPDGA